jgi:hypothetical protein
VTDEPGRVFSGIRRDGGVCVIAGYLGMDPADIRTFLGWIGEPATNDVVPHNTIDEIHGQFDPHCERTVPQCYPDPAFDMPTRDGMCRCAAGMGGREHQRGKGCT